MKNLNNNKNETGLNIEGITDGFTIQLGVTIEEKISMLQSIKDSMATCMMISMNDEIGVDVKTTSNLQMFYMQADIQIKKLQQQNYNRVAMA